MSFMKLAGKIAKIEGKKSQAKIGDIREILKILVDMAVANYDIIIMFEQARHNKLVSKYKNAKKVKSKKVSKKK